MSRKLHAGLRSVPMLLVMGIIFLFSEQPGDTLNLPPLPNIDKLAHAAVYGMLAATVIFAFSALYKERNPQLVTAIVVLFCLFYGILDEFHQSFVPGRSSSGFDVLADVTGAFFACLLWISLRKYICKKAVS